MGYPFHRVLRFITVSIIPTKLRHQHGRYEITLVTDSVLTVNTSAISAVEMKIKCQETVAYPGIFFRGGGGSTNSVEDRENGDLGVVAP